MLADYELLLDVIGTRLDASAIGLPTRASHVEAIANPKEKLREAVREATASRSRRYREANEDIGFLYEPIGRHINLERLEQVNSYRDFKKELTETLLKIGIIREIHNR